MSTLLPNHEAKDENDITAGQLLCGGLFASDCLSNWLSAVALTHGMIDQEGLKTELLKVQVASIQQAGGKYICTKYSCHKLLVGPNFFEFWKNDQNPNSKYKNIFFIKIFLLLLF